MPSARLNTIQDDQGTTVPSVSTHNTNFIILCVLAAILLLCYYPMILQTARTILFGDDMAHGIFAPIVALYIAWNRRDALFNATPSSWWGLPLLVVAAILGVFAALAISSTFSRVACLFSLAGCLLLLGGVPALKQFRFPLALLLFTFPVPDVLYGEITQPLQLLSTRLSEFMFETLGLSVLRDGNILQLTYMTLSVVEACSGLRSLITLFFFCIVYTHFFETGTWMRLGISLLAVPAAILVNALRITVTGLLGKYNLEWTRGTYHEFVGWTAFFAGFGLVFLVHRAIRRVTGPPAAGVAR